MIVIMGRDVIHRLSSFFTHRLCRSPPRLSIPRYVNPLTREAFQRHKHIARGLWRHHLTM
jgi:hypothetical protein